MDGISSCSTWSFHGTMSWMPDLKWTQIQKKKVCPSGTKTQQPTRLEDELGGMHRVVLSSLRDFKSAIEHVAAVGHGDVISDTFQLQRNSNPGEKIQRNPQVFSCNMKMSSFKTLWELFQSIYSSQRIRKQWKMNHVYLWTILLWDSFSVSSFSPKKCFSKLKVHTISRTWSFTCPSRHRSAPVGQREVWNFEFFGCPKIAYRWIFLGGKKSSKSQDPSIVWGAIRAMWLKNPHEVSTHPPKVGLQRRQPSTKLRTRSAVSPWNSVRCCWPLKNQQMRNDDL